MLSANTRGTCLASPLKLYHHQLFPTQLERAPPQEHRQHLEIMLVVVLFGQYSSLPPETKALLLLLLQVVALAAVKKQVVAVLRVLVVEVVETKNNFGFLLLLVADGC